MVKTVSHENSGDLVTDTLIACGSGGEIGSYKRTTICSKGFSADKNKGRYLVVLLKPQSTLQAGHDLI